MRGDEWGCDVNSDTIGGGGSLFHRRSRNSEKCLQASKCRFFSAAAAEVRCAGGAGAVRDLDDDGCRAADRVAEHRARPRGGTLGVRRGDRLVRARFRVGC